MSIIFIFSHAKISHADLPSSLPARPLLPREKPPAPISGSVADPHRKSIARRTISLTGTADGVKRKAASDSAGRFQFPSAQTRRLHPASLRSRLRGTNQPPAGGGAGPYGNPSAFVLEIQALKQDVQVTEQAPLVNTANPNTSLTSTARALEDLPTPAET